MQKKYSLGDILARLKIKALNEMQEAALQTCLHQDDVVLLSATGSGKTLAFLLPVLELLQDFEAGLGAEPHPMAYAA